VKICVCIKQVPASNKIETDEKTGVLKRAGTESKMNPYDLFAIETALRLKEKFGKDNCKVTAVTMGPMQAKSVIREAFMMGVDEGYLLSDRAFAGADVLATSYTLSQGMKKIGGFDLYICGKQTTDGDTAQVGPELSEHLNIPHASWVRSIDNADERGIEVTVELAEVTQKIRMNYPCLITTEKDIFQPRLPSYRRKLATEDREVRVLTLSDMPDNNEDHYGMSGSPTKVEKIYTPKDDKSRVVIEGDSDHAAGEITKALYARKFI